MLDAVAEAMARSGVARVFGLPGGGTSALVGAVERAGIPFVLTHTETGAVLMASTEGESTGRPGIVLTSLGPGAAAATAGLAHCLLDRAPVLVITDRLADAACGPGYHQWLDQSNLLGGVVKGSFTVGETDAAATFAAAYGLCIDGVPGPVHLDMPAGASGWRTGPHPVRSDGERPVPRLDDEQRRRVADARRPVLVAGLGARRLPAGGLDALVAGLRAPVLTTYKGKGAVDELGPWSAGIITGGAAEQPLLQAADLVVTVGLDGVELLASMPPLRADRVELAGHDAPGGVLPPTSDRLTGDLQALLGQLPTSGRSEWGADQAGAHRAAVDAAFETTPATGAGLHPWRTARVLDDLAGARAGAQLTVDAGAHMLPLCQAWRARSPGTFWISNGLSTMGYALPAAIARSLAEPERPVLCCTGDGGLLMAAGELATAARAGRRLVVVVFDDRSMSLIRIKQGEADLGRGVDFGQTRWAEVASGLGMAGAEVDDEEGLRAAVGAALDRERPSLVSVRTDASPYADMLKILRG